MLLYPSVSTLVMEQDVGWKALNETTNKESKMRKMIMFLCEDESCNSNHEKTGYTESGILVCKKI